MEELRGLLQSYVEDSKEILGFLREQKSSDHELLIKLDTRLTMVLEQISKMLEDHEDRLRDVEKSKGYVVGYLAGAVAAAGIVIHFVFPK
jgi:hypothetical protein